jgi:hypothetical protein
MQISGARVRRGMSWPISFRLASSQPTSIALTPSAVEIGHSGSVCPCGANRISRAIIWPWRSEWRKPEWGSHEHMPVAISLDAIGEPGEARVTEDLSPTSQVEFRL